MLRSLLVVFASLAVAMFAVPSAPAVAGQAIVQPAVQTAPSIQGEPRWERYQLLPHERRQVQDLRAYQVLTVAALAGGAAAIGVMAGSPVLALAVAGGLVVGYLSLP